MADLQNLDSGNLDAATCARAELLDLGAGTGRWLESEAHRFGVGSAVGVSPVYLTQVFRQVEGLPLYRYQLNCGSPGPLTCLMIVQV